MWGGGGGGGMKNFGNIFGGYDILYQNFLLEGHKKYGQILKISSTPSHPIRHWKSQPVQIFGILYHCDPLIYHNHFPKTYLFQFRIPLKFSFIRQTWPKQ